MFLSQKHEPTVYSHAGADIVVRFWARSVSPPLRLLSHLIMLRGWHSSRGFCTCWDIALSFGNISGQLYLHALPTPPSSFPEQYTDSSLHLSPFHSLVNYITHLSPGLSSVGGTAGVVPGAQILGNINQTPPAAIDWDREGKGKDSPPLPLFLSSL